jgi:hypothetical protein
MLNGDISNESSRRLIITADVVAVTEVEEERKFLRQSKTKKITSYNNPVLSELWNMANRHGLSVELAGFKDDDWTQEMLDQIMDKLDRRGGNPFNYAELYESVADLVGELPYRNNLMGVVDTPERMLRYGSWGIGLNNL